MGVQDRSWQDVCLFQVRLQTQPRASCAVLYTGTYDCFRKTVSKEVNTHRRNVGLICHSKRCTAASSGNRLKSNTCRATQECKMHITMCCYSDVVLETLIQAIYVTSAQRNVLIRNFNSAIKFYCPAPQKWQRNSTYYRHLNRRIKLVNEWLRLRHHLWNFERNRGDLADTTATLSGGRMSLHHTAAETITCSLVVLISLIEI